MGPVEVLRSHSGPVFGTTFLGAPFPPGLAVSAGVHGPQESAELTLWEVGGPRYQEVGRLGWQLPASSLQNLSGAFDVRQVPGTNQVLLCGFGSDVNLASIHPLSSCQLGSAAPHWGQQQQQQQQAAIPGWPGSAAPSEHAGGGSPGRGPGRMDEGMSSQEGSAGSAWGQDGDVGAASAPLMQHDVEAALGAEVCAMRNWLVREATNLKYSSWGAPLPPPGAGYTLRTDWVLRGHAAACVSAAAQDGLLATASFDGSVRLWRAPQEQAGSSGGGGEGEQAAPVVLEAAAVCLDEESAGEAVLPPVCCVAIAPDCQQLVSGGNDRQVKLWDVELQAVLTRMHGHTGWVWNLAAVEDSLDVLASGATDSTVRLWDVRAGAETAVVEVSTAEPNNAYPIGGMAIRQDNRYIVCGCFDGSVYVIDCRAMKLLHKLAGHSDRVTRVSCQGDAILSGSFDGNVCLWQF
ncbi:hypothetical protein CHLNCDRAFT_144991 [Chlorella variabilis]|uniref:Uncharacterized protein n=1 Tax=Chlorella variabilis TaxID=554065 RepID=E1ZDG1_CHLVA|nr:hypothetical protein CHLNCDRAFT_144991 [Chlorella variabilis]EFN56218.1 hypothetical protein CHLNCDRAFT_144991 [Chlorella variabilis]|eukprot:XP_005848320.1 hypothetical protein CHLNCDRAFT_144991 [Chlorella variabilis]